MAVGMGRKESGVTHGELIDSRAGRHPGRERAGKSRKASRLGSVSSQAVHGSDGVRGNSNHPVANPGVGSSALMVKGPPPSETEKP